MDLRILKGIRADVGRWNVKTLERLEGGVGLPFDSRSSLRMRILVGCARRVKGQPFTAYDST
jgi:hypothetical protein